MDEKALFTQFWTHESGTTRNVLARIPEGSDYRPDPKSRTAQEIAWQIYCEEAMIIEALETGKVAWAPPPMPTTMREIVEAYEKQSASIAKRWKDLPAGGKANWTSSAGSGRPHRWRGVSCSIWSITAARSRRTSGRWARRCRRSTDRARTSLERSGGSYPSTPCAGTAVFGSISRAARNAARVRIPT